VNADTRLFHSTQKDGTFCDGSLRNTGDEMPKSAGGVVPYHTIMTNKEQASSLQL
jgi:hypothetical protein